MSIMKNPAVKIGLTALAAYAFCVFVQRNVTPIPVVGQYLPS